MSDTDDTEELLLIPPHFFLHTSQSEESLINIESGQHDSTYSAKYFVENLVEEVGLLQLRLENLESVSFSEIISSSGNVSRNIDLPLIDGSPESKVRHIKYCNDTYHTFPRCKNIKSCDSLEAIPTRLPLCTVINSIDNKGRHLKLKSQRKYPRSCEALNNSRQNKVLPINLQSRFSLSSFESESPSDFSHSLDILNMDSENNSSIFSPEKRKDNNMLCDIDTFLNNITRVDNKIGSSSSLSAPMHSTPNHKIDQKDFLLHNDAHLFRSEAISLPPQLHRPSAHQENVLNTPKVDYTSHNNNTFINQNSKTSTANYLSKYIYLQNQCNEERSQELSTTDGISKHTEVFVGSLKNSVPDLGYGMRDIMFSNNQNSVLQPVIEDHSDSRNLHNTLEPREVIELIKEKEQYSTSKEFSSPYNTVTSSVPYFKFHPQHHTDIKTHSPPEAESPCNSKIQSQHSQCNLKDNKEKSNLQYKKCTNEIGILTEQLNLIKKPDLDDNMNDVKVAIVPNNYFSNQDQKKKEHTTNVLPSLSHLWRAASNGEITKSSLIDPQKYEEEILRREHCERVIQQLQRKLLEDQQKLAVAVQVDCAKDEALFKLREACMELSQQISLNEEQHTKICNDLNNQLKCVTVENRVLQEKVEQHDMEISKLLNVIHDTQENSKITLSEKDETIHNLQKTIDIFKHAHNEKDERYNEIKESHQLVAQLNKQLSNNLENTQTNFDKVKQELNQVKDKLVDAMKLKGNLEDEISLHKSERGDLRCLISEEKSRNSHLNEQKSKLQESLDAAYKKIKFMESDFELFKKQIESQKNDQKVYYQKQVEQIVMNKLNDFQNQLEAAENVMESEMQSREQHIAMQFAKQLHKVEQQHKLEVGILEEKQKEEIKLYRIQLAKSDQTIQHLQQKLESYKNKRGQIAAQLHDVMENQWQQALKIITNGAPNSDGQNVPDQLKMANGLQHDHGPYTGLSKPNRYESNTCLPFKMMLPDEESNDAIPCKDNNYYTSHHHSDKIPELMINRQNSMADPPNHTRLGDEGLQHYVKMLLQKPPGTVECPIDVQKVQIKPCKNKIDVQNMFKNLEECEFPTSDKVSEATERKLDKNSHIKRPWK